MSKIFITGSSTGLGALTAKKLINLGNDVTLHARNRQRAIDALKENPQAKGVIVGDLSQLNDIKSIAEQVNGLGKFDTIIHNAGVSTPDSFLTSRVNVEAPYMLTALINKPNRIIYVSSGMHKGANLNIAKLEETVDYSASKLALMLIMKKVSNIWNDVSVNAIGPGWVPTRMGGTAATDDLTQGYLSQVWLATSNDPQALKSGNYYYHMSLSKYDDRSDDLNFQNKLFKKLYDLTRISFE